MKVGNVYKFTASHPCEPMDFLVHIVDKVKCPKDSELGFVRGAYLVRLATFDDSFREENVIINGAYLAGGKDVAQELSFHSFLEVEKINYHPLVVCNSKPAILFQGYKKIKKFTGTIQRKINKFNIPTLNAAYGVGAICWNAQQSQKNGFYNDDIYFHEKKDLILKELLTEEEIKELKPTE